MRAPWSIDPEPLRDLIARAIEAPTALVGLGIPRCPASELLAASLPTISASRPDLDVGFSVLAPEDWRLREELLWPRGIRVSRSSVPALTVLRAGRAVAHRAGGGPAAEIDSWLQTVLGPSLEPVPEGLTEGEVAALAVDPARRAQHHVVKTENRSGPPKA